MAVAFIPLLLVVILFLIVPVVGFIVLQVYLSKMEKDWPGLILPILSLSGSVISILGLSLYAIRGAIIITFIIYFILINIPTVVFFLIYKNVHKKQSPNKELDKMTIQDLS